jgi:hypothetical protein
MKKNKLKLYIVAVEILLKVVLNTITLTLNPLNNISVISWQSNLVLKEFCKRQRLM